MADFIDEKARDTYAAGDANPVVESAEFALKVRIRISACGV